MKLAIYLLLSILSMCMISSCTKYFRNNPYDINGNNYLFSNTNTNNTITPNPITFSKVIPIMSDNPGTSVWSVILDLYLNNSSPTQFNNITIQVTCNNINVTDILEIGDFSDQIIYANTDNQFVGYIRMSCYTLPINTTLTFNLVISDNNGNSYNSSFNWLAQ